jgi:hypothetical protein
MKLNNIESLIQDYIDGKLNKLQSNELLQKLQDEGSTIKSLEELDELTSRLENIKIPEPSANMSHEFYVSLHAQSESQNWLNKYISVILSRIKGNQVMKWSARMAFAVILIVVGWRLGQSDQYRVDLLRSEVSEMQKMFSVSMLKDQSPAKRIQALQYITRFDQLNYELRRSVFDILNRDPNVNVRLEALEILILYTGDKQIRQNLVLSIGMQSEPMMQMAMAEAMVSLREKRAIAPLKKLLLQKDLNYSARLLIIQSISDLS